MRTPEETRKLAAEIRSKSAKDYLEKAKAAKKEKPMNEDFAAIGDVITLIANEQPGEATSIVNDLLGARIADALQSHKQDIAKTLFAPSADALAEEIVQEEHESVEEFKKRGGTVKQIPAHKSYSAPKSQKIKVPFRMGKDAMREEIEQLDELSRQTLGSYAKKATGQAITHAVNLGMAKTQAGVKTAEKPLEKRSKGILQALGKLTKEEVEQLVEMPTRKHFQQVADVIKAHPDAAKRKELAAHHAGIFKTQNPRFDHKRFYAAAGAGEPGI